MSALVAILVAIAVAFVFKEVLSKIGIPRTVGEVLAGAILTIPILHTAFFSEATLEVFSLLAEMGLILLFFFVGLEINLKESKKNMKEASLISVLTTVLLFAAGVLVSLYVLGLDIFGAAIVGIAVAASGVAMSVDFLEELGLLKSHVANIVITAGAVADLIQFVLIGIILALINTAVGDVGLTGFVLQVILFAGAAVLFKVYVIPWALKFFAREHAESSVFAGGIMITLTMAVLSDYAGLGTFLGALLAGLIVRNALRSETLGKQRIWEQHALTRSIHTISFGFLVPLVFVQVGLNLNFGVLLEETGTLLILFAIAFFGMIIGSLIGVVASRGTWKEGVLVGLGIAPKGDVELAIATLALTQGIISQNIFAPIVGMAVLTTIVAPIVFKFFLKKWSPELLSVARVPK
jgi:Kef-type K+ transport system membrane component KefB